MDQFMDITLSKLNNIIKESDEIYRQIAKAVGLSDCEFWILYTLRRSGNQMVQNDIISNIYLPKQTVNSALKKMELEGSLILSYASNRRYKDVILTEKGKELAKDSIDIVIQKELSALSILTEDELTQFLSLYQKYTNALKFNMRSIKNKEKRDKNEDTII